MNFTSFFVVFTALTVSTNADQGISAQEGSLYEICDWSFLKNTTLCGGPCGPDFTGPMCNEPLCDYNDPECLDRVSTINWKKVVWIVIPVFFVLINFLAWFIVYLRFMRRRNVSIEEFVKMKIQFNHFYISSAMTWFGRRCCFIRETRSTEMWFKKSKPSKSNTLLNKPGSTPRAQSPVRQPKELAEQSTSSGVSEHQSDETKPAQRSKKKTFRSKLNREDGSEDGGASQQTQEENQNSAVSDLFAKLGKRKSRRPKKGSTESADHKEEKSRGSKETVKGKENDTNREKTKYDPKVQEAEIERLATKKWYHGLMPRDEIEEMLRDDGDFCVRTSDVGHNTRFIMSIMWKNKARHMVIGMNTKKEWYLKTEQGFATIDELIVSFIANKTVLHKEGTMLKRPILRPSWYILHDSIKLFKKVGGGSFGDVFMAELQLENKVIDVAVKILKGEMGKKERSAFMKEASINRKFNHPNIVRLLGVAVQLEPMMVVLELAPNGSLRTFVKTKTDLTVSQLTYYLYNAAKGLAYLAELGVIHRDIAARNCLLSDDYTVKISDFGLSVAQSNLKENKLVKMPVRWLAPETLISRTFSLKTDVWSYGVMVWEVYSRCKTDPWPGKTNAEARAAITNGQTMEMPSEAPDYGVHVMKECWIQKPEDRITMAKVVRELKKIVED